MGVLREICLPKTKFAEADDRPPDGHIATLALLVAYT